MKKTTLKVKFELEGWHCWPEAPLKREYLRFKHRHKFYFVAELVLWPSQTSPRSLEFHDVLDHCKTAMSDFMANCYDRISCEELASELCRVVVDTYSLASCAAECWEDNECGARVEI